MKPNNIGLSRLENSTSSNRWIDEFAKKILVSKLEQIRHGKIILRDAQDEHIFGNDDEQSFSLQATITVHEQSFYSDIIFGGTVGSGEAYMARIWDCPQLTNLIRILVRNDKVLNAIDGGFGKLMLPLHKAFHFLHRNTLTGSRKNISAHYDLGNDMFELFLDPTMMYSSGVFISDNDDEITMEQASITKLDRICQKLQLSEDDHVLEIGTGWGGFAIHAAKNYGCCVTTTTISRQQFEYAQHKVKEAGLEENITLLCEDYRILTGTYDKLVSIEMIEAVGHAHYKDYFKHCSKLLRADGMMLLQSITIADQRFDAASKEVDFIQRYIFPGGSLPSINVIASNVNDHTDMRFYHLEDIGEHYARTLELWRKKFFKNIERIRELGYSETFIRMWEFYLCYCEGGFREHSIGTIQLLLTKPECRREPVLVFDKNL